uniref:Uncharacterized protein n=1 Tax=Solanum lycopersicum TaxID=4081 RepID=A0A3Q7I2Y5_SOLLC
MVAHPFNSILVSKFGSALQRLICQVLTCIHYCYISIISGLSLRKVIWPAENLEIGVFGHAYFLHETDSSEIGRNCGTPIERIAVLGFVFIIRDQKYAQEANIRHFPSALLLLHYSVCKASISHFKLAYPRPAKFSLNTILSMTESGTESCYCSWLPIH